MNYLYKLINFNKKNKKLKDLQFIINKVQDV